MHVGVYRELGEAEGVALFFLPRSPDAGNRKGSAIGHADPPALSLAALIAGLEEAKHRHQTELSMLPSAAIGRLLTHRLGPSIHRGIMFVVGRDLPFRYQPIAGYPHLPLAVVLDQDWCLIVLPHLLFPVVTRVIDSEVFHQHRFGRRNVVDAHGRHLHQMKQPGSSGQPQPSIIRRNTPCPIKTRTPTDDLSKLTV
ncbi:hypothetical protein D3C71_1415180 [compost metagenome]